jgi:predicted nucleotidyltransferase
MLLNLVSDDRVFNFLKKIGAKHGATKVVLFGSRARGDSHDTSDYDVAFFGLCEKSQNAVFAECENNLITLKKIDVSFEQNLDEKFLQNIKKEGIILYERNKN